MRTVCSWNSLENGELFELELSAPMPPRNIGLISLEGVPLSAAAERFISIVLEKAKQQQ